MFKQLKKMTIVRDRAGRLGVVIEREVGVLRTVLLDILWYSGEKPILKTYYSNDPDDVVILSDLTVIGRVQHHKSINYTP